jgi:DNA-binding IclR family transcriptional regulator
MTLVEGEPRQDRRQVILRGRLVRLDSVPGRPPVAFAEVGPVRRLYEATHENVQLAVLDGFEVVYVERICGRDAVPSTRAPACDSRRTPPASGWSCSRTPAWCCRSTTSPAPLRTFTSNTVADHRQLRAILAEVRRRGYAVRDGQVTLDALSVAGGVVSPSWRPSSGR